MSGLVLAAAPFWSVFVAIGLLPFVAVLLLQNGIRPFLRWQNLVLALPLAGLLTIYLFQRHWRNRNGVGYGTSMGADG